MENKPDTLTFDELRSQVYEKLERIAVAFGSAGRLKLIQVLSHAPHTVEDLANATGQTIANTSQHLQRLAREGLVVCSKSGVSRIYRIKSPQVVALWESLQDLAHELVLDLDETENRLTDASLRAPKKAEQILKEVSSNEAVLIDVRFADESKATPLEGALVLPLEELKVAMKKLSKKKPIYVFCRGRYCPLASEAVKKLRAAGFTSFRLRESPFRLAEIQKESTR